MISTKTHGYLDYTMGALLILAPWLFGFANDRAETIVPVALGVGIILYSLFTDYELSISRIIAMRTHLRLDIIGGIFLAVSPWLFNFKDYVYLPHLIFGLLEIGVAARTRSQSGPRLKSDDLSERKSIYSSNR
jgi:hypothetical protein